MRCKVTKKKIKTVMSFGKMPMANGFLLKKDFKKEFFYNLKVGFNEKNFLFQVIIILNPLKFLITNIHFLRINQNI